jgi:hypothetical protein
LQVRQNILSAKVFRYDMVNLCCVDNASRSTYLTHVPVAGEHLQLRLRHAAVLVRARLAGVGGDVFQPLTVCSGQRFAGG